MKAKKKKLCLSKMSVSDLDNIMCFSQKNNAIQGKIIVGLNVQDDVLITEYVPPCITKIVLDTNTIPVGGNIIC